MNSVLAKLSKSQNVTYHYACFATDTIIGDAYFPLGEFTVGLLDSNL